MIEKWEPGRVIKRNAVFDPDNVGERYVVIQSPNYISLVRLRDFRQIIIDPESEAILFDDTGLSILAEP